MQIGVRHFSPTETALGRSSLLPRFIAPPHATFYSFHAIRTAIAVASTHLNIRTTIRARGPAPKGIPALY